MNSNHYHGKSCKRCNETLRYISDDRCVPCAKAASKRYFSGLSKNKQKAIRARARETYKLNRENNPEKYRKKHTEAQRKSLGYPSPTRECPKFCELCGAPQGKKSLALDHDHETGEFRGWLCSKCNMGLGLLGDTIQSVKKAYIYLLSTFEISLPIS